MIRQAESLQQRGIGVGLSESKYSYLSGGVAQGRGFGMFVPVVVVRYPDGLIGDGSAEQTHRRIGQRAGNTKTGQSCPDRAG